jgi:hypothetical protein
MVKFVYNATARLICETSSMVASLLMVWSLGGLAGEATLKTKNFKRKIMEIAEENLFKQNLDYLKLVLKISKLRYKGQEPPKKLLQQAREIGRLAGISRQELYNL